MARHCSKEGGACRTVGRWIIGVSHVVSELAEYSGMDSEQHLWDKHSLRMNLHRFLPSEMRPDTPMPRWSSILKSFRWKVPISADVLLMDASTMWVLLCTHRVPLQMLQGAWQKYRHHGTHQTILTRARDSDSP